MSLFLEKLNLLNILYYHNNGGGYKQNKDCGSIKINLLLQPFHLVWMGSEKMSLDPQIIRELEKIVGQPYCRTDQEARLTHSYDATPLFQAFPHAVVYPQSTEEVQAVMKVANRYQIPVISRGSGTNLSASAVPVNGGIVMVFNRMNNILEIDTQNLTATVQPGVITRDLHEAVSAHSLFYPPDPGSMSISTIGGNIAQGAGGLRGLKYGTTKDYVLGLEAVLANGEVIRTGGKLAKDVSGYDVTKLMVGSEGTLAIITEATLKLLPQPAFQQTMVAYFPELDLAAEAVSNIISSRIIPCTLEFMDQGTMEVVEAFTNIGLPTDQKAMLILEQDGPPEVVEQIWSKWLKSADGFKPPRLKSPVHKKKGNRCWKHAGQPFPPWPVPPPPPFWRMPRFRALRFRKWFAKLPRYRKNTIYAFVRSAMQETATCTRHA